MPLFHGPKVQRMGTVSTSCYIMWTRDSALDNNGPFQPNHFVPLFASSEKKEPITFGEIVKHRSLKYPRNAEEAKGKECPSMSKWPATPLHAKKRKWNETNTAKRAQPTAETSPVKECVDEDQQTEGTSAVETPSVEECIDEEQQTVGTSAVEYPPVEEFGNEGQHRKGTSVVETPPTEKCGNEEQHTEETSVVEPPLIEEFGNEEQHISVVETPPVEEIGNEDQQT